MSDQSKQDQLVRLAEIKREERIRSLKNRLAWEPRPEVRSVFRHELEQLTGVRTHA